MRLKKVVISNFRSYEKETSVNIEDLSVFVGKNDIGKSTILEALDIFFNENKGVVKIDKNDINKKALEDGNNEIKIGVVFDNLPREIIIDEANPTSLEKEYLLNREGCLEIIKKFPNAGKEKIYIKAYHPTNSECADLLLKKQEDLKKLLTEAMACDDKTKNAEIRRAIWSHYSDKLGLKEIEIELAKMDAKNTWEKIKNYLPLYSLFQSDRNNSDGDSEIQNPMKLAVQEILKDQGLKKKLDEVANEVRQKLEHVSSKTLEKLNEMNPEIAESLNPVIPSSEALKWSDVFKSVSITGDEGIPINKRGSGVKRLVLLNFFRAEAERKRLEKNSSIIYAVEEPETSQHPKHQRQLVEALISLAQTESTQIILTTHSPAIVKLLEFNNIKLVRSNHSEKVTSIERNELPYPSLNEVNYLAFGEADVEYHNELYGYLKIEGLFSEYSIGQDKASYVKIKRDGTTVKENITMTEYIRHQIHHPENTHNERFSSQQLQQSIQSMRIFIQQQITDTKAA